ncbi:MAG: hypothetical protein AAF216_01135 [Pseudomonadota bacterium]
MTDPSTPEQDFAGLNRLWYTSIVAGLVCALGGAFLAGYPGDGEPILLIMSIALGAAIFGGVFFIGANLAGVQFESRVRDETRIRGSNVEHVTHVEAADDPLEQKWLDRYVWARNIFGGLIIPLLIFAALFVFN